MTDVSTDIPQLTNSDKPGPKGDTKTPKTAGKFGKENSIQTSSSTNNNKVGETGTYEDVIMMLLDDSSEISLTSDGHSTEKFTLDQMEVSMELLSYFRICLS